MPCEKTNKIFSPATVIFPGLLVIFGENRYNECTVRRRRAAMGTDQSWDRLGETIEHLVDQAVKDKDYKKLSQSIRQTVGQAVDMGGESVRRALDSALRYSPPPKRRSPPPQWQQPGCCPPRQTQAKDVVVERRNVPALYGSASGKTAAGVLQTVGGSLLACGTFVSFLSELGIRIMAGASLFGFGMLLSLAGMAVGVVLSARGIYNLGMVSRFKTYRRILGDKTHCSLDRLARGVGKSVARVRKELAKMISQGLFLEGHLDNEKTLLITSNETYEKFERSRIQMEQRQRREAEEKEREAQRKAQEAERRGKAPQLQEVLDRGNEYIAQIRRCNDAIPGEEISGKISKMETIVRQIFRRAEEHPEIVPDLKKLMDYYLPMTVKLLNAYADMDAQPVSGETIQSSKREIEETLDTLNFAFEKLLDSVFKDTAMDVSSDISVLNTLLAQEGLTGDDFTADKS